MKKDESTKKQSELLKTYLVDINKLQNYDKSFFFKSKYLSQTVDPKEKTPQEEEFRIISEEEFDKKQREKQRRLKETKELEK